MKSIVLTAVLITISAGLIQASGPMAVYALVDKVTFEPNADKPERIRVSGVFITAEPRSDVYSAPQHGILYFTLPARNAEVAQREWSDLKSVAGTQQVVAFGSSWYGKATVRKTDEEAKTPEDYTMGNGLVKMNADHPRAKALLDYKDR